MKSLILIGLLLTSLQALARVTIETCTVVAVSGRGGPTVAVDCEGQKESLFACNYSKLAPGSSCSKNVYDCVVHEGISVLTIYADDLYTDVRGEENFSEYGKGTCFDKK